MKKLRRAVSLSLALMMLMTAAMSEEQIEVLVDSTPEAEIASQEPTEEPMPEAELTEEPTTEPTVEPTIGPTVEPDKDPTVEPTNEPATEPTVEPLPAERLAVELGLTLEELADKLGMDVETLCHLDEVALRELIEQVEGPEAAPTEEPIIEPTEEPIEEPNVEPTVEPTDDPTQEPEESAAEATDVTEEEEDGASKMYTEGCDHQKTEPYSEVRYRSVISFDAQNHVCQVEKITERKCTKCGALTECVIEQPEEMTEKHQFGADEDYEENICPVCYYMCKHEGYATFYWVDNTDFTDNYDEYEVLSPLQHRQLLSVRDKMQKFDCQICGIKGDTWADEELTYSQPEAHQFDAEGRCTLCQYESKCEGGGEHEYYYMDEYTYFDTFTSINDQYHEAKGAHTTIEYGCKKCYDFYCVEKYDAELTRIESHVLFLDGQENNGFCVDCKYKVSCDHQSLGISYVTYEDVIAGSEPIKNNGNGTHTGKLIQTLHYECLDCGYSFADARVIDGTQACQYGDGVYDDVTDDYIWFCTIFGAKIPITEEECPHDDPSQIVLEESIGLYGEPTPDMDGKGHSYPSYVVYRSYYCMKCGNYFKSEEEDIDEPYTEGHNLDPIYGDCDICGYVSTCAHQRKQTETDPEVSESYYGESKDAESHYEIHLQREVCVDCKSTLSEHLAKVEAPHKFFSNGICRFCDYVAGTTYPVTKLTLSADTLALEKGQSHALTVTVYPDYASNKGVTWTSDNGGVATVIDGKVTAVAKGVATITCTAADGSGASASCRVTVTADAPSITKPTDIKLLPESVEMSVGQTQQLKAELVPENATTALTYTSSDSEVARVSESGLITALAIGSATITVKTSNGKTATCKVRVTRAALIIPESLTLGKGETYTLKPEIGAVSSATFTYTSSNASVVKVSKKGRLTAVQPGPATITVTADNGLSGSCAVTVVKAPAKVTLSASKATLGEGESIAITATLPSGAASK